MRKVSYLSYTMTTADANNPDGIVPVGRQFDFIGDVETEEMILVDGDESLCLGYTGVEVYKDVYVGDMMEYKETAISKYSNWLLLLTEKEKLRKTACQAKWYGLTNRYCAVLVT